MTEEEPRQISLTDVTWKDYNDGEYDTLLYFSFSNGSIVDKEFQHWGFVKNIECRDITGDGYFSFDRYFGRAGYCMV